jgi:hypothetical protein
MTKDRFSALEMYALLCKEVVYVDIYPLFRALHFLPCSLWNTFRATEITNCECPLALKKILLKVHEFWIFGNKLLNTMLTYRPQWRVKALHIDVLKHNSCATDKPRDANRTEQEFKSTDSVRIWPNLIKSKSGLQVSSQIRMKVFSFPATQRRFPTCHCEGKENCWKYDRELFVTHLWSMRGNLLVADSGESKGRPGIVLRL